HPCDQCSDDGIREGQATGQNLRRARVCRRGRAQQNGQDGQHAGRQSGEQPGQQAKTIGAEPELHQSAAFLKMPSMPAGVVSPTERPVSLPPLNAIRVLCMFTLNCLRMALSASKSTDRIATSL